MPNAVKFKQRVNEQPGEVARLKVVQGPDSGCVFVLTAPRATMGRGEENDIVFSDLRASRRHAEIFLDARGAWGLKDLGSANGIVLDGQVIRQGGVKKGDRFTVGETTVEFQPGSSLQALMSAPVPGQPRSHTQQSFSPALAGMGSVGAAIPAGAANAGIAGLGGARGRGGPTMNPRMLVLLAVIAVIFFLPDEEAPKTKKAKKQGSADRDLASYLPEYEAGKTGPAEMFFREGFREYREKNYIRAKTQFETVLQVAPGHRLATIYLRNCENAIEQEVGTHLIQGKKDGEIGKLKSARNHYEAVLRLLHRDHNHASYLEAKEAILAVDEALKGVAKQ